MIYTYIRIVVYTAKTVSLRWYGCMNRYMWIWYIYVYVGIYILQKQSSLDDILARQEYIVCKVCGVRCAVCGVRCAVCGVRCNTWCTEQARPCSVDELVGVGGAWIGSSRYVVHILHLLDCLRFWQHAVPRWLVASFTPFIVRNKTLCVSRCLTHRITCITWSVRPRVHA